MAAVLTVRVDDDLEKLLKSVAESSGKSRSEVVRDALDRHLKITRFQLLRARAMPYAEAAGYLTDEDVFRDVS